MKEEYDRTIKNRVKPIINIDIINSLINYEKEKLNEIFIARKSKL